MKFRKKSQGALEFMVIFGFLLFFFVAFLGVIQKNMEDRNSDKERIILQNIALDVRDEINLAVGSSEGYSREFKIPENILGRNYEANLTKTSVYVHTENVGFSYKIPEINGSIKKGNNLIIKENGTVYLN